MHANFGCKSSIMIIRIRVNVYARVNEPVSLQCDVRACLNCQDMTIKVTVLQCHNFIASLGERLDL